MTKHGKSCPHMCSQCADIKPRIVTVTEHAVLVDGKKVRGTERSSAPFAGRYSK